MLDVASSLTNVLAETTNGTQNASTITYLYGLGLVGETAAGQTEYNLADALGSVRQLADVGGQVLLAQTFDPYGNPYAQSSIVNQPIVNGLSPFGWTGEQSDPSGLTYLRARYYAPGIGRFTQIDPFAGALALPASMNGFGYAHGNPVRYKDPSGEILPFLAVLLIGAAIDGGLGLGITYGTELYAHRSIIEKEGFWAAQKRLDWGRIGTVTAIGAVSGALGVETQRQCSDKAIARTTPLLLGLFSWITLAAHALHLSGHPILARQSARSFVSAKQHLSVAYDW